jgi:hypothetical protein
MAKGNPLKTDPYINPHDIYLHIDVLPGAEGL